MGVTVGRGVAVGGMGVAVGVDVGVDVGKTTTGVAVGEGGSSEAHPTIAHVMMSRAAQSRSGLRCGLNGVIR